jgi:2-dehydropantoate 2-reductase
MNNDILIIGTGALATLFAARLASTGVPVTMLGTWKDGIESLQTNGAQLLRADGTTLNAPVRATDDPEDCKGARLVLVLVKAWQTERISLRLQKCLADDGLVVTLQNGLGNREILARALGPERVALGVTTNGATLLGPGLARSGGEGPISIETHPRLEPLEQMLNSTGFRVDVVRDAQTLIWGKLVINAAINPLTALLRIPNGGLLERPVAHAVMAALARETAAVARALDVRLPFPDPVSAAEEVARKTAANRSSMFQDVKRGAPTEIDAICGAVVRTGREKGVRAPANWAMWRLVNTLAASPR